MEEEEKDFALPTEGTAQRNNHLFAVESLVYGVFCLNCILCCFNIFLLTCGLQVSSPRKESRKDLLRAYLPGKERHYSCLLNMQACAVY